MIKYLLLFVFIFASTPFCFAQEDINTIFSSGIEHSGGYGAVEMKLCPSSDCLYWIGGRGGWILNRSFSIGGAGYGLIPLKSFNCPTHLFDDGTHFKSRYAGGYGGLFLEYINSSNNVIHFTGNLLIGAGGLTYFDVDSDKYSYIRAEEHPATAFFILEPGISADINISKFFRIGLGVSYKITPFPDVVYDSDKTNILDVKTIEGLAVNLSFKFGKF